MITHHSPFDSGNSYGYSRSFLLLTSKLGYSAQQFPATKTRELRQEEELRTSLCRFKMNSSGDGNALGAETGLKKSTPCGPGLPGT